MFKGLSTLRSQEQKVQPVSEKAKALQQYLAQQYGAPAAAADAAQPEKKKKKKKRNPEAGGPGLRILDEDVSGFGGGGGGGGGVAPVASQRPLPGKPGFSGYNDEDAEEDEDQPVVVNPEEAERLKLLAERERQFFKKRDDGSGWNAMDEGGAAAAARGHDTSPPHRDRHDSPSSSPPRRQRHDSPDAFPQRWQRHDSPDASPPRRRAAAADASPPRRQRHDSQDASPPRRQRHDSPDASPPRRRAAAADASPPRRQRHDSPDASPPRRHAAAADSSPPRRQRHDSPDASPPRRRAAAADASPPRRQRHDSPDASPPRRRTAAAAEAADASPPRRQRHDSPDASPPRRHRQGSPDASPPRRRPDSRDASPPRRQRGASDASPPRKRQGEVDGEGAAAEAGAEAKRRRMMSDGTVAGMVSGRELMAEMKRKREIERQRFAELEADVTGRGAQTVFRDREGRRVSKEEYLEQQAAAKKKAQYDSEAALEWGGGLRQRVEAQERAAAMAAEAAKPFARSVDDPELDAMHRRRSRWGDPMAGLVKSKPPELEAAPSLVDKHAAKLKQSGFIIPQEVPRHSWLRRNVGPQPNRYGIQPGRHWDGVDRSNGFERDMFKRQNELKRKAQEAYMWAQEDM